MVDVHKLVLERLHSCFVDILLLTVVMLLCLGLIDDAFFVKSSRPSPFLRMLVALLKEQSKTITMWRTIVRF